jgi:hypothetical protein
MSAAETVSPPFITSLILVETTIYTPHLFQQFYGSNELWQRNDRIADFPA